MTPWWSRPTAEDPSEEDEFIEPLSEEEEEEVLSGAAEPSAEETDDGGEADASAAEESAGEEAAGEEKPKRRRRRTRKPKAGDESNGESADKKEPEREKPTPKAAEPPSPAKAASARAAAPAAAPAPPPPAGAPVPGSVTLSIEQLRELTREIVIAVPDRGAASADDELKMALFCDLENIALGVRDSDKMKFEIELVLERLVDKGKIIVKKAYADWNRYSDYKRAFHSAAIEMIDIPQKHYSGKNSADIKMVVDAMDLCYAKEHLDTFVVLSGDSDFSPLVSKLKENNKTVIGVGVKNSTSALLIANCDEFLYYEDIWRDAQKGPQLAGLSEKSAEVFALLIDAIQALERENKTVLWGSMIKQTMQRKRPSFNEGYYGYSTFSDLLQDAEKHKVVTLKKDQRSGSLVVTGHG